eukprot:scaffold1431_cov167-Ochromonas_danica.AAC.2
MRVAILTIFPLYDPSTCLIGMASKSKLSMSTYWEGKAPPSSVLGLGQKIPSIVYGPASLAAFVLGLYSIHEHNILHTVTPETINPILVAGSALVPISWGLHVAAWIQKENNY